MNHFPESSPRRLAVDLLRRWEKGNIFARNLLEAALCESSFPARERAFITNVVNGVIRRKKTLDWLIDSFSPMRRPPSGSILRQILRLSIFQLLYLEKVPPHAVLHQAGELAREDLSSPERAYINALLRKMLKRRDTLPFPSPDDNIRYLSVVHSHPEWLIRRWLKRWDPEAVANLCRSDNAPPPIFIRVNRCRIETEELAKKLKKEGVTFSMYKNRTNVLTINPRAPISSLPSFRAGYLQVQDVSSLAVVELLDPRPGESVADFCAAPGGKACFIAEKMKGRGKLLAADSSGERLKLLRENFARLGVTGAEIIKLNLLKEAARLKNFSADKILLDVPCSNTGVLRRRVDARWRIDEGDIGRLAARGLELLIAAAGFLRTGGKVVYSTCSLEGEENEEVVKKFLKIKPGFVLIKDEFRLPVEDGGDGYFAAVMEKWE